MWAISTSDGYADVLGHLAAIRDEAEQLRHERSAHRRTMFMLLTGPLMVLVVLIWARTALFREG